MFFSPPLCVIAVLEERPSAQKELRARACPLRLNFCGSLRPLHTGPRRRAWTTRDPAPRRRPGNQALSCSGGTTLKGRRAEGALCAQDPHALQCGRLGDWPFGEPLGQPLLSAQATC